LFLQDVSRHQTEVETRAAEYVQHRRGREQFEGAITESSAHLQVCERALT
jgi:hypothetical protein